MKTLTKTLLCVCGLSLVPLSFSWGKTKPEYRLPKYEVAAIEAMPKAYHNPAPQVSSRLVGTNLELKLTINEKGRPESVRLTRPLTSYSDLDKMTFASQVRDLVSLWKFEPAFDTRGNAIAVDVKLPIQVIEKAGTPTAIAKLILDEGYTKS